MHYEENGVVFDQKWLQDSNGVWTIPCLVFGHPVEFHVKSKITLEEKQKCIRQMTAAFFWRMGRKIVFDIDAYELWLEQAGRGRSFERFFCFTDMHFVLDDLVKREKLEDKIGDIKLYLINNNMFQSALEDIVGKTELSELTKDIDDFITKTRKMLQIK